MQRHTLIALIVVSTVALAIILMYALLTAPLFTLALLAICAMAVLFVLSEQSQTHDAAEYENRFWTSMAFVLACACLYSADSPLRFPEDHPGVAFAIVVLFTFLAHNYDRHLRRLVLSKIPNIKKVRSADFPAEYRVNASEKCAEIRRLVASIDQTWMSSTILNLFFLPFVLFVEHQIVTIFAEANRDELNLIISGVELGLIFYKIKDHKIANRYNRTKLLKLLSFDRVTEMNIPVRALVVDGMQRLKISANPQCEIFVANIFLKTKGDELSELKSLTDSKGDFNSMHRLIFTDIRTPEVKKRLLDYIQQQANVQDAHKKLGTKKSKVRDQFAWRKILSDVDDTLTSSGGSWPAGTNYLLYYFSSGYFLRLSSCCKW